MGRSIGTCIHCGKEKEMRSMGRCNSCRASEVYHLKKYGTPYIYGKKKEATERTKLIIELRNKGKTFQEIGDTLNCTRQAVFIAYKRYQER